MEHWQEINRKVTWGHYYHGEEAIEKAYVQTINETRELWENKIIQEGDTVLDVGSGNGRIAFGLQSYPIEKYYGLEAIKQSVKFCKRSFKRDRRFQFIWMDLKNEQYNPKGKLEPAQFRVSLQSGSVNAVICMSLFSHLETVSVARKYVDEIYRLLKPGGRFFSSWFRSPPNTVNEDPFRTVYPEATILEIMENFNIYKERGGKTDGFNDQWCLFALKE